MFFGRRYIQREEERRGPYPICAHAEFRIEPLYPWSQPLFRHFGFAHVGALKLCQPIGVRLYHERRRCKASKNHRSRFVVINLGPLFYYIFGLISPKTEGDKKRILRIAKMNPSNRDI